MDEVLEKVSAGTKFATRAIEASLGIHGETTSGNGGGTAMSAGGGGGGEKAVVSSATRRRGLQRARKALEETQIHLEELKRYAVLMKEATEKAIEEAQSKTNVASGLRTRLEAALQASENLSARIADGDAERAELALKLHASETDLATVNADLEAAKTQIDMAATGGDALSAQLASSRRRCDAHKAAVARLTADNLVLVTRCASYDEELVAASEQMSSLRAAAEHQQGEWFDRMRERVEGRVRGVVERAEEETGAARRRAADAEAALEQCERELVRTKAEVRAKTEDVESERSMRAVADKAQRDEASAKADEEAKRRDGERREEALKGEVAVLTAAAMDAQRSAEIGAAERKAAVTERDVAVQRQSKAEAALEASRQAERDAINALAAQKHVNEALMRKKEELEWNYLGLSASMSGTSAPAPQPQASAASVTTSAAIADANANATTTAPPQRTTGEGFEAAVAVRSDPQSSTSTHRDEHDEKAVSDLDTIGDDIPILRHVRTGQTTTTVARKAGISFANVLRPAR